MSSEWWTWQCKSQTAIFIWISWFLHVHATFAMCTFVLRSGKYRSLCLVTVSAVSVLRPSYQYWYRSTNIMKIVQSVRLRLSRQASVTGDSSIGLMSFYWSSINQWVYSITYQHIQDKAFFVGFSRPARSLQCCITSNHQPCLGDIKISGKVLSVILYNVRFNSTDWDRANQSSCRDLDDYWTLILVLFAGQNWLPYVTGYTTQGFIL